jgi:hypothetical protein
LLANSQRVVPALVFKAQNPVEQACHAATIFANVDTGDVEQRRNLHRKRAIVVFVGLECAHEIVRGRPQCAGIRRERASVRQNALTASSSERRSCTVIASGISISS